MNEVRPTKSSLSRQSYIQQSIANSKCVITDNQRHTFPLQICTNEIKQLKEQIAVADEELESVNKKIDSLHYNIPIKIRNLEQSNTADIQKHKSFLNTLNEDFEKALIDLSNLKLKEQKLIMDIQDLERSNAHSKIEIDKYNYNLFKKGQLAGHIDFQESMRKPCDVLEIEKIWSDIREAELELLKWQNIDCQCLESNESEIHSNKRDLSEYLISFIMDALLHFVLDDGSESIKEAELNHLISFFDFNEEELSQIKLKKIR